MGAYLDLLLGKAYLSMPGEHYNRYRQELADSGLERLIHYEISLMEDRPWEHLRDRVYPSFARYLKDKSLNPESPKGVIVAVFRGATCYLIKGEDFIEVFKEMEGLNATAYHFRVLRWLSP